VAVLHPTEPVRRSVCEFIALANAHEEETAKVPVSIQTSRKRAKEFSVTANRGTRRRGNSPRPKPHCRCRRGHTVRETLEKVKAAQSEIKVGISFTTINNALRVLTRRVKAFSYGIFQ